MLKAPAAPALTPSVVPTTGVNRNSATAQRRLTLGAAACSIAFVLLAISAFVWREHQLALEKTGERATRHAERLAQDLEQTLTVAQTVISQVESQLKSPSEGAPTTSGLTAPNAFPALLAALPLPFDLHAVDAKGTAVAIVGTAGQPPIGVHQHPHGHEGSLSSERWGLSKVRAGWNGKVLPLTWRAASNDHNIKAYGVDLELAALNNWLERDRLEPDDRVTLFWMNADGSATVMARMPTETGDLGRVVRAPWVQAANRAATGLVDQMSAIDGLPRRVAFQQLAGAASDMVVVYGAGTHMALADWRAKLPFFLGLALFLIAALSYGAWRLDRTLKALTESERHLHLMLDSGNVWDWDIGKEKLRYSPMFLPLFGFDQVPADRLAATLFKALHPEDVDKLKAALVSHLRDRKPYEVSFRVRDASGQSHWFESKGQAFWDSNGRAQYMAGTTFEVTERVALEEAQRQTLQRLDMVANASSVLFWTADLEGKVNWVNRRWLAFTGRSLEDSLGDGWLESIHPEDKIRRNAFIEAVKTSDRPLSTEYRLRDKDGMFRWVVAQSMPLRDADQRVTGFIGSGIDVTELKKAEDAARQRGAMLEAMFNLLQDLLFVMDQDGRFIHFQGASCEQLYVPPDMFLGKLVREVMPPSIAQVIHEQLELARNGALQEFEYVLALPDGEQHFDARIARLPDSEHYMVVARNITERYQLRQQREHLRQFMTLQAQLATNFINSPMQDIDQGIHDALAKVGAFAEADRAYIFEYDYANNQTSNTHEWCAATVSPEIGNLQNISLDIVGDWVEAHARNEMVSIPEVLDLPQGELRRILEPQRIRSLIALPMMSPDGCIGFVGFDSIAAHHDYDENQIGLLRQFAQMLVNIYARRATDAKLQRLAAELEQRVRERTAQLDVSVRRLRQANQELESFAYSVSHDLKAPLRSVEGFASLLLEEHSASLNAEGRHYLTRIQGASLHMARLISDLLAYCRMEDMDKLIAPVQLLQTTNDVISGMLNELEANGAKVHLQVPADIRAMANPHGLAMVLRNLMDNAIKFTKPGSAPQITLTARTTGAFVYLCLKDEGQGFDMKYHDRIFALFQRLHRPEAVPGTGIGLAMVFKAVQRMNGRIWAESKPGEGAQFHIELPRA